MIPYIEILNKYTRQKVDIVEPSEFWCELQYYGVGEFEIYAQATARTLACLTKGNYVKIPKKNHLWVIEKVEKTYDADRGLMISASGRQAKAILAKRIINVQTQLATSLEATIKTLINKHAGINAGANRAITGLQAAQGTLTDTMTETQVSYDNLLTFTDELLQGYECGARLEISGTNFVYTLYKGQDRSDAVVFSQAFDNLTASTYTATESNFKNYALIGGQGEGAERILDAVDLENKTGIDRCEVFVDAKDISNKYTDAQGQEQTLDITTAAGLATYKSWLRERGKQKLAEFTRVETFNGDIDTANSGFDFGTDYNLGDIVRVQDSRLGVYIEPRILKFTINQTADEYAEKIEYGG